MKIVIDTYKINYQSITKFKNIYIYTIVLILIFTINIINT